jgi:hypothetical protein
MKLLHVERRAPENPFRKFDRDDVETTIAGFETDDLLGLELIDAPFLRVLTKV